MNDRIENQAQSLDVMGRVRTMFGETPIPGPFNEFARHPAFLTDFYMNFKRFVWSDGYLDIRTKSAIGLAVSFAARCPAWSKFFSDRVATLGFRESAVDDIRALVATCSMYNLFFKLPDLSGNSLFGGMAVGLRGHTPANTCLDEQVVEIIHVAISTINGCKTCTAGHIRSASRLGLSQDAILESIQCAATTLSGCSFLNTL